MQNVNGVLTPILLGCSPSTLPCCSNVSKIGVRFVDDAEGSGDCSDGFQLFSSEEVVVDSTVGLTVISPEAGDMAYVGEEYTLLVSRITSLVWKRFVVKSFFREDEKNGTPSHPHVSFSAANLLANNLAWSGSASMFIS